MKRLLVVASTFLTLQVHGGPKLEPLREQDIDYRCGCSFQLPSSDKTQQKTILQWELGERANVRIDGKHRKLEVKELRNESRRGDAWKVGDRTVFELRGDGVSATAACTVTDICPMDRPACEVTLFAAKLTVRTEKGKTVLNAHASCGC